MKKLPTLLLLPLAALAMTACDSDPMRLQACAQGAAYFNAKQYDVALPLLTRRRTWATRTRSSCSPSAMISATA